MPQPAHITFIHGLANKPAPEQLRRIWLEALGAEHGGDEGFSLEDTGVTASFLYWADLFYDEPIPAGEYEAVQEDIEQTLPEALDKNLELANDDWARKFQQTYPDDFEDAETTEADLGYERIPLPGFIKRRAMKAFTREAHSYLFNVDGIRDTIRQRALDDFAAVPDGTRHVLVGHSQGSFIAYDVLTGTDCKPIDGFMTLGSPLGVDEIQDELNWTRDNGFPQKVRGDWVNVYDSLDVVARPDPKLANDFRQAGQPKVIDVNEQNWGRWRHSATKYYKGSKLRGHLRALCGREED
jgi:hypothetical protein